MKFLECFGQGVKIDTFQSLFCAYLNKENVR